MAASRFRFSKDCRLRKRSEFLAVQRGGHRIHGRRFVVLYKRHMTGNAPGRLGITASKRVGNAVRRNRIKRLVREVTRTDKWVPAGFDVVVVARVSAVGACIADIRDELSLIGERIC